ncbi:NAD-dependent epimerase/dehydratase [Streptomyces sp. SCL15-6]|uniref:NAD-dependent epimerase/dehydratase family protein n=1 Tax=Streptomyces sp. SCL15-6 TaxID=2967222 RepID=UPI002966B69C|nr:NAD-dependent epimerase/dehydratase [Streptomyces sp. SCL15-6]
MIPRSAVVMGGTGSLGRHICAALLRTGDYRVTAVARHDGPVPPGVPLLCADPLGDDEQALGELVTGSDVVVNAAGAGWGGTPHQMAAAHAVLVERLLGLVPPRTRLVHLGSVHEYGAIGPRQAADEDHPERPTTVYGRTKLVGTRSILASAAEGRSDAVILRVTNVCGPGAPATSFLGSLIRRLRELPSGTSLDLQLTPDLRDFIDIRDVADAVVRAVTAPVSGLVINIGRGHAHEVPAVADLMIKAAGFPRHRVRIKPAAAGGSTGGHGAWTKVDVTRARALLNWSHSMSLEESLRDQWDAAVPSSDVVPGTATT